MRTRSGGPVSSGAGEATARARVKEIARGGGAGKLEEKSVAAALGASTQLAFLE
jgi:hypothetical protein